MICRNGLNRDLGVETRPRAVVQNDMGVEMIGQFMMVVHRVRLVAVTAVMGVMVGRRGFLVGMGLGLVIMNMGSNLSEIHEREDQGNTDPQSSGSFCSVLFHSSTK